MGTFVVVVEGVVVNRVVWDGEAPWTPPAGAEVIDTDDPAAVIGATYDGETFTAPGPL